MTPGRLMVAAAMLVWVAACGNDDAAPVAEPEVTESVTPTEEPTPTPSPIPEPVKPCELLTREQVESVSGTPVDDPIESPEACMWTAPVTGPLGQVEVFVGDGAKKILDVDRDLGHELVPVQGAGDEAYVEEGAVFMSKGGQWVAIRVVRLDDFSIYRKALVGLARSVAKRL